MLSRTKPTILQQLFFVNSDYILLILDPDKAFQKNLHMDGF